MTQRARDRWAQAAALPPGWAPISVLGRGARSMVYQARWTGADAHPGGVPPSGALPNGAAQHEEREYALKVLDAGPNAARDQEASAFRREAALLACLHHPGLVGIHEVGTVGSRPYLVMDLVEGRSLAEVLRRSRPGERQVAAWAAEVAAALAVVHQAGLVHRDIKPDNVLVAPSGRVRLIDFGLAGRAAGGPGDGAGGSPGSAGSGHSPGAGSTGSTGSSWAAGTFAYSAPEQTGALNRAVDGRADLYALGVVIFECLTGKPPFVSADVGELLRLHLSEPAPDLRHDDPELAPALARIVTRLLAKDPDDRYRGAPGLAADLARVAAGERDFPIGTTDVSAPPRQPRLVGRDAPLNELATYWQRALRGTGGTVLLTGPAGIGKSRLVRELTGAVASRGHAVLSGACTPDSAAYAPIRQAIDGHLAARRYAGADSERLRVALAGLAGLLASLSPAVAATLGVPHPAGGPNHRSGVTEDQFAAAVARLLVVLAQDSGGAVLHLDDAHWCDAGTRAVLRSLAPTVAAAPLLLVACLREPTTTSVPVREDLSRPMGAAPPYELRLVPLAEPAVAALVAGELGAEAVSTDVATALAGRAAGNPLAVREYVRAAIDAGLLRPYWGQWRLAESGLAELELPADVLDLVLRRVDVLDSGARAVLAAAAVAGTSFDPAVLCSAYPDGPDAAWSGLGAALSQRLLAVADGGRYVFVHERIREVLLARLAGDNLRELHQRLADALERGRAGGPEVGFELARHYLRGYPERAPRRAFEAAAAAGALALRQFAPTEAHWFLAGAARVAAAAGLATTSGFHADLGMAALRIGEYDQAIGELTRAVDLEPDPATRAPLLNLLADAYQVCWNGEALVELGRRGLAELGHPLPRDDRVLVLSTFPYALLAFVLGRLPHRWIAVTGERADRFRLLCALHRTVGEGLAMLTEATVAMSLVPRVRCLAYRLGPGPELAQNDLFLGWTWRALRMRRLARRLGRSGMAKVTALRDPALAARTAYLNSLNSDIFTPLRARSGAFIQRALREHGNWMETASYLNLAANTAEFLLIRGYVGDATAWQRGGLDRGPNGTQFLGSSLAPVGARISALAGRHAEAARQLAAAREFLDAGPRNLGQRINLAIAAVQVALEQDEHGAEFERAVGEFRALDLRRFMLWANVRMVWVYEAQGRIAQAVDTPVEAREDRIAAAARSVSALRRVVDGPVLRAYHQVAVAALHQLRGDNQGALRGLGRVQGWAAGLDVPLLDYEIERVRARACRDAGHPADARRHAEVAHALAHRYGWHTRARWIRAEFALTDRDPAAGAAGTPPAPGAELYERRLEAVHQVSLAAASVLEPAQLTRAALDEIVSILGAERAFLFLRDEAAGGFLLPYLGRDTTRTDLTELTGYGSSLVRRVDETGEPLVVTGSEEGEALGSLSSMVYGLRSIMVVPLQLRGQPLGVVYLDSRAAKGIFTDDDLDLLTAITNHIALALQTARVAQLELSVRIAERERDTVQLLHEATRALTASLDTAQVEHQLLDTVTRALHARSVVLVRPAPISGFRLVATGPADGVELPPDPALTALLHAARPTLGTPDLPRPSVLPPTLPWLAVPLETRGHRHGVLLATAEHPLTQADAELALALAGQGMTALDNAQLFSRVEQLATRDVLTDLLNRRQFLHLAESGPPAAPACALMIDIDHFKAVNDTYGHAAGDEVIREVGRRLAGTLRGDDIVCRYGGEEFAALLPGAPPDIARAVADRLHQAVRATPIITAAGPVRVTVSVGIAQPATDGGSDGADPTADLAGLLRRADAALYMAKTAGRDQVATYPG